MGYQHKNTCNIFGYSSCNFSIIFSDDYQENVTGLQTHTYRQLARSQAKVLRRPIGCFDRFAGLAQLLCLETHFTNRLTIWKSRSPEEIIEWK